MSIDVGAVVGALRHILSQVQAAASAANTSLPDRQYVTTGGAVYDCAQVSVSGNSISTGIAGAEGSGGPVDGCPPGWNMQLELAVVREAAEVMQTRGGGTTAPSVTDIELDTVQASADAAVLTDAVEAIAGPGWDQYGAVPASIQFGEVQGGLTAVVLTVTLNLWSIQYDQIEGV